MRPSHKASQSLPVAFEEDKVKCLFLENTLVVFFWFGFFYIFVTVHAIYLTVEPNSSQKVPAPHQPITGAPVLRNGVGCGLGLEDSYNPRKSVFCDMSTVDIPVVANHTNDNFEK